MIYGRNVKGLRRAISATVLLIGLGVVSGPPRSVAAEAVLDAIPTPPIFQNPFMAPNNFSEIHFNSFQTDTASVSGPASASGQAVQQGLLRPIPGIAGTIAFNSTGQILTVAGAIDPSAAGQTLMHEHIFIDFKAPPPMMPPPTGISVLKPAQPAPEPPPAPAPGGRTGRGRSRPRPLAAGRVGGAAQ